MATPASHKHITEHEWLILHAARAILGEVAERCNAAEFDAWDSRVELRRLIVGGIVANKAGDALSSALITLGVYLADESEPEPVEPQSLRA